MGMVWLEGDNPENSSDSRYYGPIRQDNVIGRVVWKFSTVFPFVFRLSSPCLSAAEHAELMKQRAQAQAEEQAKLDAQAKEGQMLLDMLLEWERQQQEQQPDQQPGQDQQAPQQRQQQRQEEDSGYVLVEPSKQSQDN